MPQSYQLSGPNGESIPFYWHKPEPPTEADQAKIIAAWQAKQQKPEAAMADPGGSNAPGGQLHLKWLDAALKATGKTPAELRHELVTNPLARDVVAREGVDVKQVLGALSAQSFGDRLTDNITGATKAAFSMSPAGMIADAFEGKMPGQKIGEGIARNLGERVQDIGEEPSMLGKAGRVAALPLEAMGLPVTQFAENLGEGNIGSAAADALTTMIPFAPKGMRAVREMRMPKPPAATPPIVASPSAPQGPLAPMQGYKGVNFELPGAPANIPGIGKPLSELLVPETPPAAAGRLEATGPHNPSVFDPAFNPDEFWYGAKAPGETPIPSGKIVAAEHQLPMRVGPGEINWQAVSESLPPEFQTLALPEGPPAPRVPRRIGDGSTEAPFVEDGPFEMSPSNVSPTAMAQPKFRDVIEFLQTMKAMQGDAAGQLIPMSPEGMAKIAADPAARAGARRLMRAGDPRKRPKKE